MTDKNDPRFQRLDELQDEVFEIANSFAGNETGVVAMQLHEAVNCISRALRMLEKGNDPGDILRLVALEPLRDFMQGLATVAVKSD
jgi:hypothetical protein